jgi:outer membrane lipoprotein-sorting protein
MNRSALAIASVLCLAVVPSCRQSEAPDPRSAAIFAAAQQGLEKRIAALRDYTLVGTAKNLDTGAEVPFTYTFAQPRFARATVGPPDAPLQTLVFDGDALVVLDHSAKSAMRIDRSGGEQSLLLAIHQAFADFACEGWRPPLLRAKGTRATAEAGPDGERFHLVVSIDDPALKEERIVLRSADASFIEKQTLDSQGQVVAWTRVMEELVDPETGLKLPRRWEKKGPLGRFDVSLGEARVNVGSAPEAFRTTLPEGYNVASAAAP